MVRVLSYLYTSLHEQMTSCSTDNFRKTVLLERINEWYLSIPLSLSNDDYSIRVYQ